jgi:hypothetical protein
VRVRTRTCAAHSLRVPYHSAGAKGNTRAGTRSKVGARVWAKAGTGRERERRRRRAGGQNERVPNRRPSLRVREECTHTRNYTPSPSSRLPHLHLHSHPRVRASLSSSNHPVPICALPHPHPPPSTAARDAQVRGGNGRSCFPAVNASRCCSLSCTRRRATCARSMARALRRRRRGEERAKKTGLRTNTKNAENPEGKYAALSARTHAGMRLGFARLQATRERGGMYGR